MEGRRRKHSARGGQVFYVHAYMESREGREGLVFEIAVGGASRVVCSACLRGIGTERNRLHGEAASRLLGAAPPTGAYGCGAGEGVLKDGRQVDSACYVGTVRYVQTKALCAQSMPATATKRTRRV